MYTIDPIIENSCPGDINGLKAELLFIDRSKVTDYPVLGTLASSEDVAELTGDYEVAVSAKFSPLPIEVEMSSYKHEAAGAGFGPYKTVATVFVKGSNKQVRGVVAMLNYCKAIYVLKDANGDRVPIGNADYPAYAKANFDSKTASSNDPRGWEIEITSYTTFPSVLSAATVVPIV